jgi:hypothetical protein
MLTIRKTRATEYTVQPNDLPGAVKSMISISQVLD